MSREGFQPGLDFEAARDAAEADEALIIDIDGYEGPLHVLLALARTQKVDLLKLSVLRLAEQYLDFVHKARQVRFSLAADYLVMAAWLAYLKSRLLLPRPERPKAEEPPAETMAADLAFRLARLDAIRRAAEALAERPQTGRDVFLRGDPDAIRIQPSRAAPGDLLELMQAYVVQRTRQSKRRYQPRAPGAYPLEAARDRLRALLPELERWTALRGIAAGAAHEAQGLRPASFLASTLSASLELVREGQLEARQVEAFAEIFLRARHEVKPA